jgi:hypothetical protein
MSRVFCGATARLSIALGATYPVDPKWRANFAPYAITGSPGSH